VLERHRTLACRPRRRARARSVRQHASPDFRLRERGRRRGRESIYQAFQAFTIYVSALKLPRRGPLFRAQSRKKLRSLKVISLLSMQKKLAKDIFTLKKDGAKRHQLRLRRINLQFRLVRVSILVLKLLFLVVRNFLVSL